MHARMIESDLGRSSVSVSWSSSAAAATAAVAAAMTARAGSARRQVVVRVCAVRLLYHLRGSARGHNYSARSFGSQGSQEQRQQEDTPLSPSILSQSVRSQDTTRGLTTMRTVMLAQAMSRAPTRVQKPVGVIPSSPLPPSQPSPDLPGT